MRSPAGRSPTGLTSEPCSRQAIRSTASARCNWPSASSSNGSLRLMEKEGAHLTLNALPLFFFRCPKIKHHHSLLCTETHDAQPCHNGLSVKPFDTLSPSQ